MVAIKSWALMLVFISASGFIYYCLLPSGKVSSAAKSVFSVFVLAAVIIPIFGVFSDLDAVSSVFEGFSVPNVSYNADCFVESGKKITERELESVIRQYTDISYKTEIGINIYEDYSINIEYINIEFAAKPPNKREIAFAVEEKLGIHPQITEAGDE